MKYNCLNCCAEYDSVESVLRCRKCGADLSKSFSVAEKRRVEEEHDLESDRQKRLRPDQDKSL